MILKWIFGVIQTVKVLPELKSSNHTIKTVSTSIILFISQYIHPISRHVSVVINHSQVNPFLKTLLKKQSRYTLWRRLGERRYSSYSFITSTLDGGEWSASRPGRALPPGKGSPVPIVQEAGWSPEPVWTQRLEEKSFAPAGDRTPIVRSSSP
jgi:hypothetical protein